MFVANVGDSRAIICTRQPGEENVVKPLSVDQTPFRRDERERIKLAGGHVLTIDQIEGLEVLGEGLSPMRLPIVRYGDDKRRPSMIQSVVRGIIPRLIKGNEENLLGYGYGCGQFCR